MVLHEALLSIIVYKPIITFTIAMETSAYALEHDQEKDKQTMGRDRTAPEKSKAGVRFGTLLAFPFREGGEQASETGSATYARHAHRAARCLQGASGRSERRHHPGRV